MIFKVDHTGNVPKVVISGPVIEGAEKSVAAILAQLKGKSGRLTLETSGIDFINSIGLRQWSALVQTLGKSFQLVFSNAASALLGYAEMGVSVFGNGTIESFIANFACAPCGKSVNAAIATKAFLADQKSVTPRCAKCQSPMAPSVALEDLKAIVEKHA